MSQLTILWGRAGCGKTHRVYQSIGEALSSGEERLILIVPEQYTLQAERDLVDKLHLPGLWRIEVLSFTRLCHQVFHQVGGVARVHLDDMGRAMLLRRLLEQHRPHLTVYRGVARQRGFVMRLGQLIATLKSQKITPDDLLQRLNAWREGSQPQPGRMLVQKLQDLERLYRAFEETMRSEGRQDREDALDHLCERLPDAAFLSGCRVWIDGFDQFTAQIRQVILGLLAICHDMTVTLTLDADGADRRDRESFALHEESREQLADAARSLGHEVRYEKAAGRSSSTAAPPPPLLHLERELYTFPSIAYKGDDAPNHITLGQYRNPAAEVEAMAAQMAALARNGMRYREMAMVCGDLEGYAAICLRRLPAYGIPFFLDRTRPLSHHPAARMCLRALEVCATTRSEPVIAFLKEAQLLPQEGLEWLENYALAYNLRKNEFKKDFTLGNNESNPAWPLQYLNQWRTALEPLWEFEAELQHNGKGALADREWPIPDMVAALLRLLETTGIGDSLRARGEILLPQALAGDSQAWERMERDAQVWEALSGVLTQCAAMLSAQSATLHTFSRILKEGFETNQTAVLPPMVDQVLIGSVSRTKSQDVAALFVLGANQDVLPAVVTEDGLIGDGERELLRQWGIRLGGTRQFKALQQQAFIYAAFAKPSRQLWVSCAAADMSGNAQYPSNIYQRLCDLFPNITPYSDLFAQETDSERLLTTPEAGWRHLIDRLRRCADNEPAMAGWWPAYDWYAATASWRERLQNIVAALFYRNREIDLPISLAHMLFADARSTSISRLERFAECPFSHFIDYGLRPAPRRTSRVDFRESGSFFHMAMEAFWRRVEDEGLQWNRISQEKAAQLADETLVQLTQEYREGLLTKGGEHQRLALRLTAIAKQVILTATAQLAQGDFVPWAAEAAFGPNKRYPAIELDAGGETLSLQGRIDRVDMWVSPEGSRYLRVVDYKSGGKAWDIASVYHGLDLQLPVYLQALLAAEPGTRPAGLFYFHLGDPWVECAEADAPKERMKELRLNGLALADADTLRHMDHNLEEGLVLPLRLRGDGTFYRNAKVASPERFSQLLKWSETQASRHARELLSGNVNISPMEWRKRLPCEYCANRGICFFESRLQGGDVRRLALLEQDEVWEKIRDFYHLEDL